MRIFSYAVARDFGFAPNPFYGYCTLGTCKPVVRRVAKVGDIVLGTGSKALGSEGYLIYAMRVTEVMTFNSYWDDPRFQIKKPNLSGSVKKQFGDNIYRNGRNGWEQLDSHHSLRNGSPNPKNIKVDTGTDRVLVSDCFSYFGRNAPSIPKRFRNFQGIDICHKRGHKSLFPPRLVDALQDYFETLERGYLGEPLSW